MVTGNPAISSNSPSKSFCCSGRSASSAARRCSSDSAMIIARIFGCRSSAMNMCSVRHSPIPSAPSSRARAASRGVSALARTRSRRISSDHRSTRSKRSSIDGGSSRAPCSTTAPSEPSTPIMSPARNALPSMRSSPACGSIATPAPVTAGTPIPRATSAACDALPPSEVRMPLAT